MLFIRVSLVLTLLDLVIALVRVITLNPKPLKTNNLEVPERGASLRPFVVILVAQRDQHLGWGSGVSVLKVGSSGFRGSGFRA